MFIKFLTTLIFTLLISTNLFAQNNIVLSDTLKEMGDILTGNSGVVEINVVNNTGETVKIRRAYMNEPIFNVNIATSTIAAAGQAIITITARPRQNITYTDFLIVEIEDYSEMLFCEIRLDGKFENNYYNGTENKWGSDLKAALHNIIKGHTAYPYSSSSPDVWDILKNSDEDPNNSSNVILLYTGWSYKKSAQNTGDNNGWNREHSWAKSHGDFSKRIPEGTDAHHLRPADVTVNSRRGSLDFDNGGNLYTDDDGATGCRVDGDSWEPRDLEKGDVARMMYYMAVRYEGDQEYGVTTKDLELVDYIPSSPSKQPKIGKLSTLYTWHLADTVSAWERRRNERIFSNWQHNRNPFIDYPQLAERLPSISGMDLTNQQPRLTLSADTLFLPAVDVNQSASYKLELANSGGGVLNISDISFADNNFNANIQTLAINEESIKNILISFSGTSNTGLINSEMTITSDDPENPVRVLPVAIRVKNSTGIDFSDNEINTFSLSQNYPNPFNPETVISYNLAKSSKVILAIYDILGRKIQILVDGQQKAGIHKITFFNSELPGGVYFYTIYTNTGRLTRKMILLP